MKAAIIVEGEVFTGYSHADAISNTLHGFVLGLRREGFLTDDGKFLNRREAFSYAKENGLIDSHQEGNTLQSWMLH